MSDKLIDRVLDKGIDFAVVIVGILIALSIDSCRESQKSERQWNMFAEQFKSDAERHGESYPKIIEFYRDRVNSTKTMIVKVNQGHKKVKELGQFIRSMGRLQADYPLPTLYKALVQSGNERLINDTKKLRVLGVFYAFEKLAMTKVNIFTEYFSPEHKKLVKIYFKTPNDISSIRDELNQIFQMYLRMMEDNLRTYKKQEENRLNVLGLFSP